MRSAALLVAMVLAVATPAFAQRQLGPAYVTRVAAGDLVYAELLKTADGWRAGGAFGPARDPAGDSTQAKLIALSGR